MRRFCKNTAPLLLLVFTMLLGAGTTTSLEARGGGGRSSGRSSGSFSRGPSRFATPGNAPRSAPTNPGLGGPSRSNSSGFGMRGLFGAVAGGMLTSMLLRSLGINLAFPGLEIILWAVVGYFVLRWLLRRFQSRPSPQFRRAERAVEDPLVTGIAREVAADIFYKVQQGWMARRIGQLSGLLGPTIEEEFRRDLDALHSAGQVNRLEQINLNQVTVMHTWQEESCDYSYVRMAASMVDYTVDERSGAVVEGSATQPVTFEECWIFEKALGSPQWRLVGIEQESAAKASCG